MICSSFAPQRKSLAIPVNNLLDEKEELLDVLWQTKFKILLLLLTLQCSPFPGAKDLSLPEQLAAILVALTALSLCRLQLLFI